VAREVYRDAHAFVSFSEPRDVWLAAEVARSFAFDNGAYPAWKAGRPVQNWCPYYEWVAEWRRHPNFAFAVIPDAIGGSEQENDALAEEWQFPLHESAVVWHTNESTERLVRLARTYPRVAIGSSAEYDAQRVAAYLARMRQVLPAICDADGYPITKLHGLRALNPAIYSVLPYASADSTNVARNIGIDSRWKGTYQPKSKLTRALILKERVQQFNGACRLIT
jgi:hypothetical protein